MVGQLADFDNILDDLENINVKMKDEDNALLLLNALPKMCERFKDILLFTNRTTITLEEVCLNKDEDVS